MNKQERIDKVNTFHEKLAELSRIQLTWIISMQNSSFKPIPDRVLSLLEELHDLVVDIRTFDTQQQEVD